MSQNEHIVIQKSGKGNSIVVIDRDKYTKKMKNFLSDQNKFQEKTVKDDDFLNFIINQEKQINKIFKKASLLQQNV